jgi:hypothetical protein
MNWGPALFPAPHPPVLRTVPLNQLPRSPRNDYSPRNSGAVGVWRVLGSNQRRLSRRFYRWFLINGLQPVEGRYSRASSEPYRCAVGRCPAYVPRRRSTVATSGSADLHDVVPLSDSHLHPVTVSTATTARARGSTTRPMVSVGSPSVVRGARACRHRVSPGRIRGTVRSDAAGNSGSMADGLILLRVAKVCRPRALRR